MLFPAEMGPFELFIEYLLCIQGHDGEESGTFAVRLYTNKGVSVRMLKVSSKIKQLQMGFGTKRNSWTH